MSRIPLLERWEIEAMIRGATSDFAKSYEVHALTSCVDRLECSLREARAEVAGLRDELQELRQSISVTQDGLICLQQLRLNEPMGPNP